MLEREGSVGFNVVGPVRARPQSPDINNPCWLNGLNTVNGRTEIVVRIKERIIAGQVNLRENRRGERRLQDALYSNPAPA